LLAWFWSHKTKIKAAYIKPLTLAETGGAPYVRVKLAAAATGLGLSAIKRIGATRRFGNADYISVHAVNAFISGCTQSDSPKTANEIVPAPHLSNTEPKTPFLADPEGDSECSAVLKKAAAEGLPSSETEGGETSNPITPRSQENRPSISPIGTAHPITDADNAGKILPS
jgi:hypothetical protein